MCTSSRRVGERPKQVMQPFIESREGATDIRLMYGHSLQGLQSLCNPAQHTHTLCFWQQNATLRMGSKVIIDMEARGA